MIVNRLLIILTLSALNALGCSSADEAEALYTAPKNVEFQINASLVVGGNTVNGDLSWGVIEKPSATASIELGSLSQADTSVIASESGRYVLRLDVVTGDVLARFDFVVEIENEPPEVFIPRLAQALVGQRITVPGRTEDPNDDIVTLEWTIIKAPMYSLLEGTQYDSKIDDGFVLDSMGRFMVEVQAVDEEGAKGEPVLYEIDAGHGIVDGFSVQQLGGVVLITAASAIYVLIENTLRERVVSEGTNSSMLTQNGEVVLLVEGGRLHKIDSSSTELSATVMLDADLQGKLAIIGTKGDSIVLLESPGEIVEVNMDTGASVRYAMQRLRSWPTDSIRLLAYNADLDVVYSMVPGTSQRVIKTLSFGQGVMVEVAQREDEGVVGQQLQFSRELGELMELGSGDVFKVGTSAEGLLSKQGVLETSLEIRKLVRTAGMWSIALLRSQTSTTTYQLFSFSNIDLTSVWQWTIRARVDDIALGIRSEEVLVLMGDDTLGPGLYALPLDLD